MFNLEKIFPNLYSLKDLIITETIATINMVIVAGAIAFIIGLILAIGLVLFRNKGLMPNKVLFSSIDGVVNFFRAIPFVILLVA
ncbi:MAG: ABC transporter permease, partial [Erysipelothrix sp.]|nr:ABC transporter permease [Erysipelothrix sp.]